MIGRAIGRRARNALIGTAVGILGLLPLRWLTPRIKLGARVWLWRTLALFVARGRGMVRRKDRPRATAVTTLACDVLLVSDALYPERGGGTRSLMRLARHLVAAGHRVAGACEGQGARGFDIDGIAIHWIPSASEIAGCVRSLSPRRLLVQQAWAPAAGRAAREAGIPYWYFARSTEEFLKDPGRACTAAELARAIRSAPPHDEVARAVAETIAGAERVVANSRFMADVIQAGFGRSADVLYPEVDEPMAWEMRRSPLSRCIVAVAATNKKGIGIVLELAKAFPEEIFLVCGFKELTPHFQKRVKKTVPNLVPVGLLPTPATYALAKLVLVPSQWPEPFGRVNAEAVLRDLPVLASRVGGIGEALPDESFLVSEFTDPAAWVARLGELRRPDALRAAIPAVHRAAVAYKKSMMQENERLVATLCLRT